MKALFWSDIHEDFNGNKFVPPADLPSFDALIVAGDLSTPLLGALQWLEDRFPGVRRIYVPGNHDFYYWQDQEKIPMPQLIERGREMADKFGIDLLMDKETTVGDTRVLGATLWTDFMLRPHNLEFGGAVSEAVKRDGMNDYRRIRTGMRSKERLKPRDTINMHKASVSWLKERLAVAHDGPTMVVTHHAPSPKSLQGGAGKWLNWCYASDLEHMMTAPDAPDFWMHGHIHASQDYEVGGTRVISNARGYPPMKNADPGSHNPSFDPGFVVDTAPAPAPRP